MTLTSFSKSLAIVIVLLVAGLVGLILLNLGSNFHVRSVTLNQTDQKAHILNQQIIVEFNRPLVKQDWSELIKISPPVEAQFLERGAKLYIFIKESLQSDTEYQVELVDSVEDIYGERLTEAFNYRFLTRSLELYAQETTASGTSISKWQLPDFTTTNLYNSAMEIRNYDVSAEQLAVVEMVQQDLFAIKLVDLADNSFEWITDTKNENAYAVQFVPGRNLIYFIKEKITYIEEYPVSDGGRALYAYSLDTATTSPIELSPQIEDIDEFIVSQDGRTILLRDSADAEYYLVDANNTNNSIPLGKFASTGGISPDSTKVLFSKLDLVGGAPEPFLVTVDSQKQEEVVSKQGKYAIDPDYANTSDSFTYSQQYREVAGSRGLFEIILPHSSDAGKATLKANNLSLELPKLSPDDRYVVVEAYTAEQLLDYANLRILGFQAKPSTAELRIYDLKIENLGDNLIKKIDNSINAKWR